jgi:DNA-directed RNA polymerase specialized sigma24 family protein
LHCLAGYEISEVAEMLGISSSTARVHLHTGRRRLLKIMAGEEGSA